VRSCNNYNKYLIIVLFRKSFCASPSCRELEFVWVFSGLSTKRLNSSLNDIIYVFSIRLFIKNTLFFYIDNFFKADDHHVHAKNMLELTNCPKDN
jgi:hypothetical protein